MNAQSVTVLVSPRTWAVRFLLSRAREASTWRGLILLATGSWGLTHPEQIESIIPLGIALAGLVGAFLPDLTLGGQTRRLTDPGQPGEGVVVEESKPEGYNPYLG